MLPKNTAILKFLQKCPAAVDKLARLSYFDYKPAYVANWVGPKERNPNDNYKIYYA